MKESSDPKRDDAPLSNPARSVAVDMWVLPWVGLSETITIGDTIIEPYKVYLARIPVGDKHETALLQMYFKCFYDGFWNAYEGMAVCTRKGSQFHSSVSPDEEIRMLEATRILAVSILLPTVARIVREDRQYLFGGSDQFQLWRHGVGINGSNMVSHRSGLTYHLSDMDDFVRFTMPLHVQQTHGFPDECLIASLASLIDKARRSKHSRIPRLILQSLEWCLHGLRVSPDMAKLSRLIAMGTAFETIFDMASQEGDKKWPIAREIDKLCRTADSIIISRTTDTKNNTKEDFCAAASFFADLYELRSKIVHGSPVPTSKLNAGIKTRPWLDFRFAAACLFWEVLILQLFQKGLLTDPLEPGKEMGTTELVIVRKLFKVKELNQALEWEN